MPVWMGDGEGVIKKSVGLNVETPKNDNKQQYFYKVIPSPFLQRSTECKYNIKTDYTRYFITRMLEICRGSLSNVSTKSEGQFLSFSCAFTVLRRHRVSVFAAEYRNYK